MGRICLCGFRTLSASVFPITCEQKISAAPFLRWFSLLPVGSFGGGMADISIGEEGWGGILRQIARRTRNQADAEDLMHSAYLRLEAYRAKTPVQDPAAFLVRTAYNLNIDNFRRDKHLSDPSHAVHIEDSAPLQDEVVEARARLDRVKEGLARLSPRTREIFLMQRLGNLKYHEIATRLGISSSAVEKHIAKAALFLTEWTEGW